MFTELNSILNISPDSFTQGEFILVSDRQGDASFLLHHFLSFYLRGELSWGGGWFLGARCRVLFLGLVQTLNHYSSVSQRLYCEWPWNDDEEDDDDGGGVSLAQAKDKESCCSLPVFRDPAAGLRSLYECVGSRLSGGPGGDVGETWGPPVVLVDDLSVLLSLGVSAGAVLDFSHYCRATVCSRLRGNVVMLKSCEGSHPPVQPGSACTGSPHRLLQGHTWTGGSVLEAEAERRAAHTQQSLPVQGPRQRSVLFRSWDLQRCSLGLPLPAATAASCRCT
ncbi:unnamed protein product [Tetraodon nigroviridis]|uniref:(spotted green pufferfish) hypothetical protein n=1 Tax=Tetraodon nigroviridis TaxID=99883 RepID=Q4T5F6_TETNG|nr:unnamed protein product [Tetraodon nigroviridis]